MTLLYVDVYLRFINKEGNKLTKLILGVGVEAARKDIIWDMDAF